MVCGDDGTGRRRDDGRHGGDDPSSADRSVGRIAGAFREALTERQSVGYTLAMTAITGALFGFINSSQQISPTSSTPRPCSPSSSPWSPAASRRPAC